MKRAVTIGNFDGVHIGHQAILMRLVEEAKLRNLSTTAVLFHPHPRVLVGGGSPQLLMTPEQRASHIRDAGIDKVVIQPFTMEVALKGVREFIEDDLIRGLGMELLVLGPTTHLGRNREGTPEKIVSLAGELKFSVVVVRESLLDGAVVNSSRVRQAVAEGDIDLAKSLLGRFFYTEGEVVAGEGRGAKLGFPTANLAEVPTMLPKTGVYATWATVGKDRFMAATNVGVHPTFGGAPRLIVEVHLLDTTRDFFGEKLRIEWMTRLRDEKRFPSAEALVAQIREDCRKARLMLR